MTNTKITVARATAIIIVFTVLSKILGFVREMALAYVFGAGAATDAFLVASTIPAIIFAVLGGALTAGAVPLFTAYRARWGEKEAWRLFSVMVTALLVLLLGFVALGEPLSRQLVWLIAPGLPQGTAERAAGLTSVVLPGVIFFSLANLYYGLLNANNIFGPPALGPVLTNVVLITGILAGARFGIAAAAWGTLAGYAAAYALQVPYLRRVGFRYRPAWDIKHPGIAEAGAMLGPVLVGTGLGQIYLIIDRILASGLAQGSISALNYAQKVALLPQGVLAGALATALFPLLAERAAVQSEADYARALVRGVSVTLIMTLPLAVLLVVLARPTVEVLFMRGAFDARAAAMTTLALAFFGVGMVGQCINPILTRGFYARQDSVTPLKCAVVAIGLNLVLSLILIHPLKHGGLALANSLAATFNIFQLSWLLKRSTGGLVSFAGMRRDALKVVVASLACGLAAVLVNAGLAGTLAHGTAAVFARLLASGSAGLFVFGVTTWFLGVTEFRALVEKVLVFAFRGRHTKAVTG